MVAAYKAFREPHLVTEPLGSEDFSDFGVRVSLEVFEDDDLAMVFRQHIDSRADDSFAFFQLEILQRSGRR